MNKPSATPPFDESMKSHERMALQIETLQHELERAYRAEKAKDAFWANTAHEIRTPLNAIIGLSHLLNQTELDDRQFNYLSKIRNASDMMLGIINDILDYSKIEAGKLDIEHIDFNINTVLDNVASMIGVKAREKNLELIFDISNDVPAIIKGDSLRLGQVLVNLLNNAVKFTERGEVVLRVRTLSPVSGQTMLEFEVADTGIGMTPEQLSKLFRSFVQAESSTSRIYGGTGLGLVISKQLVELMGGLIRAESEYGKRSRFMFTIRAGEERMKERRNYRLPSRDLMQKRVLIAEPNASASAALAHMVGYYKYNTTVVSNFSELETIVQAYQYDLIFIDRDILDGCRSQSMQSVQNSKIIMLDDDEDRLKLEPNVNVHARLAKPFNQQMVFSTILKLYDEPRDIQRKDDTTAGLQKMAGKRVLLAEDNEVNQMVLIGLLEGSGIELVIASNGEEVLRKFEAQNSFDLVLMDLHMPIMDGYEVTRQLRQVYPMHELPIIALSANFMPDDIQEAKDAGMQDFLTKPIDVNAFYAKLNEVLGNGCAEMICKETSTAKVHDFDGPGVDTDAALERLGGHHEMLKMALKRFAEQIVGADETLRMAVERQAYDEAQALMHDIKGSAANVGASALAEAAEAIEQTIRSEQTVRQMQVEKLQKSLNQVVHGIQSIMDTPNETKPLIDPSRLKPLLAELRTSASSNKARGCKMCVETLEGFRWPQEHKANLETLCKTVRAYRFKEVVQLIDDFQLS